MANSWFQEIADKWATGIAHTFILHGNVSDQIDGRKTVQDIIISSGFGKGNVVIQYDRSAGVIFPHPSHRLEFARVVGLDEEDMDAYLRDPASAFKFIEIALKHTSPTLAFKLKAQELKIDMNSVNVLDAVLMNNEKDNAAIAEEYNLSVVKEEDYLSADDVQTLRELAQNRAPFGTLIISFAETITPNNDVSHMSAEDRTLLVTIQRWARNREFTQVGSPIFLITENLTDIHSTLRSASSRIEAIEIPLPDKDSRQSYINEFASLRGVPIDNPERAAALTAGLKIVHIQDIIMRAMLEQKPIDAGLIKSRKNEIIKSEFADVLELVDPDYGFELIGGMEEAKEYLIKNVKTPLETGNLLRVPNGILLTGPAGTGKTLLATALAYEAGLNCAKFNLSKILDGFVGFSERNLEKVIICLQALAPVLVIMDEMDQSGLSRQNNGDSGVSNRLLKRLLEVISDTKNRGQIIWCGITNYPNLLDPALKRPGRFDRMIPILPPADDKERKDIFQVILRKYNIKCECNLDKVIPETKKYTGAEIDALVRKAYEVAEDSNSEIVTDEHLTHSLKAYRPTTGEVQRMIDLALTECNDMDLVPKHYRMRMMQKKQGAKPAAAASQERDIRSF